MKITRIEIENIPTLIWGEKKDKVFIAIHGNMSFKDDVVIKLLGESIIKKDYQLISFDLPEHGERKVDTTYLCKVQNCISDLKKVMEYAKENYKEINIWACSMGAYFSLLAYKDENINQCVFLSPVINMKVIIDNMMSWSNVSEEELKNKQEIQTDFGNTLYWDYYSYVKEHPIRKWDFKTSILYGKKDSMQDENLIRKFSNEYHCDLEIFDNGEHYFHTEEQLSFYKEWLDRKIY